MQLTRVFLQIEELHVVACGVINEFEAAVVNHARCVRAFAAFAIQPFPFFIAYHRDAFHRLWDANSCEMEQRGHYVLPTDESIVNAVMPDAFIASGSDEEHRDVGGIFVKEPFRP